jgi:hypothetical protein
MMTHFHRGSYDGWKYDFKTRVTEENYRSKGKATEYQFAAIERDNPTLIEMLKFYYPAFSKYGSIRPVKIRNIHIENKAFVEKMGVIELKLQTTIKAIRGEVKKFSDLFDSSELLPKIYQLYSQGVIDDDAIVILFLIIPDLNKIVSKEPFVFDAWKKEIVFNRPFYSLYIDQPTINRLREFTLRQFQ